MARLYFHLLGTDNLPIEVSMSKPTNKEQKKKMNVTYVAVIVSLLLHAAIVVSTYVLPFFKEKTRVVEVSIDDDLSSLEYLKQLDEPKKLVEFDKKNDDQKLDEKAKYLAAKNNTTKKETTAQLAQQFKNVEKSNPAPTAKNETAAQNMWEKKSDSSASAKLFNTGFDVYDKMKKNEPKQKSLRQTANLQETSTSTDKLENVDQSLMTQLNTREYKYYGYYTRIRTQLNQWWQPKVQEKVSKLMSKGRTIAATANKNTKVIIVLNDSGSLIKVQVLGASGVRELDDAAVEAFRQAAPFPNPPKGLVDADGTIKIRWDFIVES